MRRARYLILLALLLSATALGCARRADDGPLLLGVRTSNCQTPFFVAEAEGLYAERGLQAEVRLVGSNTEIIEAMQRDEIGVGSLPITTAIAAISRGAPLRIVAMSGRGSDGLLVRADGPADVASLRGARIATIRASILDVLLREELRHHGLDPDADVELVYMNTLGDMISALKTGQVDATSNTEPFMTDAEREGWGRILAYYTEVWPDHPCCVVVAHEDVLRERPDALRDALAVHRHAVDWSAAHPQESAQVVAERLGTFSADLVQASMQEDKMSLDYAFDPAEIARMAELMEAQGLIDAVAAEDLTDPAPLKDVLQGRGR